MRASTLLLATLLGAAIPRAAAQAQSNAPPMVGERVRVATAARYGKFSYVGRVVSLQGDSLSVQADGLEGRQTIPLAEITKIEVSAGTRSQTRQGMLYGTLVGGAAGAITGALTYQKPECAGATFFCGPEGGGRSLDVFAGALIGGVVGLGVGSWIGAVRKTERWIPRTLGSGARVGMVPFGSARGLTVSMKF